MDDRKCGLMPLRQLGWGFLLAWVFCVFYTNAAGAFGGLAAAGPDLFPGGDFTVSVLPLGSSVVMLLVVLAAERRFGTPASHRGIVLGAPLVTALSTPLLFLAPLGSPPLFAAFCIGSVASGFGSALMWVMWGEYYAVLPRESSEGLAPISAVSAALLVLLVSSTQGWMTVALSCLFPLLSGLCFYLVWGSQERAEEQILSNMAHERNQGSGIVFLAGLGRTGFGILGVFSLVSVAGMLDPAGASGRALQVILLASALLMALVSAVALAGPRRISLSFLYRWMCPIMVVGFAAVILWGSFGGVVAFAASLIGRFIFCVIAQIYFASYAASGRATPVQATSLGWLFVHVGDLLGCAFWVFAEPWVAASADGATQLAVLCIIALVTVVMLTLNDTAVFHRAIPESNAPVLKAAAMGPDPADGLSAPASVAGTGAGVSDTGPQEMRQPSTGQASAAEDRAENVTAIERLAERHRLTPREVEVFMLLAQGRSIPYIRDELIISRETAATHAKHIYAKLGVHSRQELIDLVQKRETEG
ncbi:response regulator transcription factor [uncultured Adlercreutzia sp.]|uniref:response regulator transcription factor n=1 Tax=uncultured Adlercreutzia sp. TaxID=875803 RepID=UPI0026F3BF2E|nr:helix-turn-helix transcriptional regulator [uncultured Adlercreutzia sp.]